MMKLKDKKGFSLVEMMVVIIIGSIIAITSGVVLVTTHIFWRSGQEKVRFQRDGSYAFSKMIRTLREGSVAQISGGADSVRVIRENSDTSVAWDRTFSLSGDSLILVEGGTQHTLIYRDIEDLTFSHPADGVGNPIQNAVIIDLVMEDDNNNNRIHFSTTVYLRQPHP